MEKTDKQSKTKPVTEAERNAVNKLNEAMEQEGAPLTVCGSCGGLFLKSRTEMVVTPDGKYQACVSCRNIAIVLQRLTMLAQMTTALAEKNESRIITPT